MKYHKILGRGLLVMFAALSLWGCGNGNGDAPSFNDVTGEHPANWLATHSAAYIANPSSCSECHGKDLLGGISKVSCAKCHPLPTSPHPAGWADPAQHGAAAKAKPGSMTGFSSCQGCHGADFGGGFTGVSCFGCHKPGPPLVKVPHAEAPWFDITGADVTHTNTDPQNAPVCANCHRSAPGTPGCFNNTLCHGAFGGAAPHAFPYPGSLHMSAAVAPFTDCLSCHSNNAANRGSYPVAAGTPPDCRSCHVKLPPGNGCGSCHGPNGGDGRPNGSAFPDIQGAHYAQGNNGHVGIGCSDCHDTNGSGQLTHGPSGGTAHGDANVIIQFTGNAAGTVYTRNVPGNGHGSCSSVPCHGNRNW